MIKYTFWDSGETKVFETKQFPNGETNFKGVSINGKTVVIDLKYESDSDLIALAFLKKHFDEFNIESILHLPYVPYSRLDRVYDNESIFSLKYFCQFIDDLDFKAVHISEPHSDVTPALLNKVVPVNTTRALFEKLNLLEKTDFICYPDNGAEKRYSKQFPGVPYIVASKNRDFSTGNILNYLILGTSDLTGKRITIVDDLCSRGGTFVLCAKALRELGASEVRLVVAHCENTVFDGDLLKSGLINKLYTTESILDKTRITSETDPNNVLEVDSEL